MRLRGRAEGDCDKGPGLIVDVLGCTYFFCMGRADYSGMEPTNPRIHFS